MTFNVVFGSHFNLPAAASGTRPTRGELRTKMWFFIKVIKLFIRQMIWGVFFLYFYPQSATLFSCVLDSAEDQARLFEERGKATVSHLFLSHSALSFNSAALTLF